MHTHLVIDRLRAEFGPPAAETASACCWHFTSSLDAIVQKDSPRGQANIWIPWSAGDPFLDFADFFDADTDRPPSTHHPACPSLAEGRPALALTIWQEADLDRAITEIRRLL